MSARGRRCQAQRGLGRRRPLAAPRSGPRSARGGGRLRPRQPRLDPRLGAPAGGDRRARPGDRARHAGLRRSRQAQGLPVHDRGLLAAPRRARSSSSGCSGRTSSSTTSAGPGACTGRPNNPDAYASTTLVDTGILYGYSWHAMARLWRTRGRRRALLRDDDPLRACASALKRGQPGRCPKRRSSSSTGPTRTGAPSGRSCASTAPARRARWNRWGRRCARLTGRRWSSGAAHDPYIKVEYAEKQRQTFPDAEVVVLPESGHWPMWDAPQEIEAAVVPFLARQLGGG